MNVDTTYLDRIEAEIFKIFIKDLMDWVENESYLNVIRRNRQDGKSESYIKGIVYDDLWNEYDYETCYSECVDMVSRKYADGIIAAIKRDETLYNALVDDITSTQGKITKKSALAYFLLEYGFVNPDGAFDGWMNYAIDDAYNMIINKA